MSSGWAVPLGHPCQSLPRRRTSAAVGAITSIEPQGTPNTDDAVDSELTAVERAI
jgi:hypothetical protein